MYSRCVFVLIIIDSILNLLEEKSFSSVGSIANTKEQNTYIFFKDVLDEIKRRSSLSSCNNVKFCCVQVLKLTQTLHFRMCLRSSQAVMLSHLQAFQKLHQSTLMMFHLILQRLPAVFPLLCLASMMCTLPSVTIFCMI